MAKDGTIFPHMSATLYETILSFLLVTGISILAAVFLWFSRNLSAVHEPYLVVLNSLPKSALAPLLIVWLGANRTTINCSRNVCGDLWQYYDALHLVLSAPIKTKSN